jgi:formyltetrahydrofolate-dependent phosphoribosylglycinamide formyltransferase
VSYRVVVAISGRGSNLVALCDSLAADDAAKVVLVIADRPAPGLDRARERGIATHLLADFRNADEWLRALAATSCDLLVLAGYLRLIPSEVVAAMRNRIINVHPALLPRYGGPGMHGSRVHAAVLAAGERESGATVHLVDDGYDRGAILAQGRITIPAGSSADTLASSVLAVEHRLLPAAVRAAARAGHPVPFEFV